MFNKCILDFRLEEHTKQHELWWREEFHVLHREIRQSTERASRIIMACGILHNICKARNIPFLDDDNDDYDSDDDYDANDKSTIDPTLQIGSSRESIRDCFANLHFG